MQVQLVTHNVVNSKAVEGDARYLHLGKSTDPENLVEFGARVCYRSVDRMGDSDVLGGCIRSGHYDVMEHGHVVLYVAPHDINYWLTQRYLETVQIGYEVFVSGNLRAWWDVVNRMETVENLPLYAAKLRSQLHRVAPNVFAPCEGTAPIDYPRLGKHTYATQLLIASQPHVQLLGVTKDIFVDKGANKLGHATFLISGVSRNYSHQQVRHRWLSYSQQSQRYVDAAKGDWGYICPPSIQSNPDAKEIFDLHMQGADQAYKSLRDLGIRKEDARFILPSAVETTLVISGHFYHWQDFLRQRVARDAQWEIRTNVAKEIETQLAEVAPHIFGD